MRILIAPDKFKGSLGAREVAEHIAAGLREVLPDAQIDKVPMADGGEGTAEVISNALGATWIECPAHDSLGRAIQARFAWSEADKLGVMEMSETAGLRRLRADERDPTRASTFGVGEMMLAAAKRGAQQIIIGLGGSATNDGGFGMARALEYRFYDAAANELVDGPADFLRLEKITGPAKLSLPPITIAADVANPLLGPRGATRTFARQKGATPEHIELLEEALTRLADIATRDLEKDFRDQPGAGAAGGLGFGLMTFCGAVIRSGFEVVAEKVQLEKLIRNADIVITGEGSLDLQTLEGKVPAGISKLAGKHGKRVFSIVGRSGGEAEIEKLFEQVFTLTGQCKTNEESMQRTPELLQICGKKLAQCL